MSRFGQNSSDRSGSYGEPSLGDFLTARPSGLLETESWAILYQAVQALQDLFLSDGAFSSSCVPIVTPQSLLLSSKGKVKLYLSHLPLDGGSSGHLKCYLAPEYISRKRYTDTETEKMWIYALGESLKRATLTSHVATSRLSGELCQILTDMTHPQATSRASLMHLLDIISGYCKKKQQHRPFSHIVMDLHQETVSALEVAMDTAWGPPAMPEIQPRTINWTDINSDNFGAIPRRWVGLTRNTDSCLPKLTKEASTSMEDLSCSRQLFEIPGSVVRPKSMYVADSVRLDSDIFRKNQNIGQRVYNETISRELDSGTTSNKDINHRRLKVRRNPVQRAASRLYRVNSETHIGSTPRECIGPEFVIRASLSSKQLVMPEVKTHIGRTVTVIMLNGQKLDVLCNPNSTTAGRLFELIIQKEHIEENFMFGLSALISGDFVFLPSDTRISKVFQEDSYQNSNITLFFRVRFFLPTLRGFRGNESRHLLYLQLRRSIIEHQLPCSFKQIVELNGLALQAEFGNYNPREHGQRDYFLIEHYIPESMSSAVENVEKLKLELIQAHKFKYGMDSEKAEESFILLAQTFPHYGGHFYNARWIMKDNSQKDIWLYISAQGMNMYERGENTSQFGPKLHEKFEWRNIQTLCYSKQYLCILPHSSYQSNHKLKKYKLKMDRKKSYFTFRLASLHHQFFLRFRTDYISSYTLSQQFGVPLKDMKNEANSLYKLDSLINTNQTNQKSENVDTEFKIEFRSSSRMKRRLKGSNKLKKAKSIGNFNENINECFQNRENEKNGFGLVLESKHLSGFAVSSNDKRRGVKMGTRAYVTCKSGLSRSMEAVNAINPEYLEEMSLQSVSLHCSSTSASRPTTGKCTPNEVYVLDSTLKPSSQLLLPNFQETISQSLQEKLNNLSFVEERILLNVTIKRDERDSFGLQITEGSDGNVYVQSVIEGGPAHLKANVQRGDQIIAVNQKSLLGLKYIEALHILKNTSTEVQFTLARSQNSVGRNSVQRNELQVVSSNSPIEKHLTESCRDIYNINKYGTFKHQVEVPYHKHIRYEVEPVVELMANKTEFPKLNLPRSLSKSCTNLYSSDHDKAIVVELIPKEHIDPSNFNSLDRKLLQGDFGKMFVPVPRTLGVSRKWRGPVKYPVTPVKKLCDLDDTNTYLSTSDEEQVFI
ncbi:tyrosine-protein phosphatase non-receptor type 13-like isoform X1 [Diorhabda carinulata]|uniref:tyrosine-protein phosphatase non-receptor type 13-like isoform X1 n=2 Tax=Diorhabda carinulata TaxID=1163345 RepID=UPI0025A2D512|nr:tyrosine-protein phosphatase non-receptor type 13-like isoform X1 [Diorhabda carinulata]XP_057655605.1 tyrosine-protein phosphatase non-receptor type 13-like isoform X1 [Diorhabda carinulata]XP_057655606.1 tyrosine-protein phosphatase non-receptor type 13-like isoform X1 [Diorhabda carinulata]